ncbi:hypothetical protein [Ktedonosporobacter rubrisoli]|uniref:hypothetical protein n=1 Tax=Ktedonosporobacter rubrisoli TaxID=2509675 RepID=UPI001A9218B9|nr:hypothetical protein [Ktedonosporobacter rubrisoli]
MSSRYIGAFGVLSCVYGLIVLVIIAFAILVFWKILSKAGYNGAWSLLLLIPGVNGVAALVIMCVLAFGEWPILRELNYLRQQAMMRGQPPYAGFPPPNPPYPPNIY